MFGQSAEDDGTRDNPLMRNMPALQRLRRRRGCAARCSATGWCIAVGAASGEGPAARGGQGGGGAARQGGRADFPGDHGNFLDNPYGEPTGVEEAADRLRRAASPD